MPWTPASLPGLIGWWDASVTASLGLTGSNVDSIADQSGSGNHLTWVIAKPVYSATGLRGSQPAIVLDAAISSSMQKTGFPMGTGNTLTVFYVGTLPSSGSSTYGRPISYVGLGQANDYTNAGSFDIERSSSSTTQIAFSRNSTTITASAVAAYPAPHRVIVTVSSAGAVTFYIDGVSVATGTSGGNWITGGTFAIGKNASANSEHFTGPLAEFGIATGFSDATTIASLDAYLDSKWPAPPSEHRVTQVALEQFASTNPAHQVTQTALEMWASATATLSMGAPGGTIVGQDDGSSNLSWTLWQNGSTPTLDFSVSGTYASKVTVSGGTIPSTGWHHVAVDKDATGKIRLYVDGVMVASNTPANSNFFNSTAPLFIGRSGTGGYYSGWLDEVRVTKGTARYASDSGFIVPTIAFPRMAEPVQPPLVSDTDGFFTPVMTQLAAGYPLLPALVASDDALPAPTVSQLTVFSPVLVASDDAIITPVVSTGVRTLAPPLVVDTDTFGSSFVTLVGLPGGPLQKLKPPPKHQDPETIFAFTSSKMSGIVIDPDTIRVPLVTAQAVILPQFVLAQDDAIPASSIMLFNGTRAGLVPSDDAVFAPLIKMILQPSLVAYDDAIPAADVGWKLFAGRLDDADVIYGPDAYSFYPLYPDLYSEDNSAETYPFLVQALQGGIPVPPREGTLTGSIKKGPHLTGSIASKRVA